MTSTSTSVNISRLLFSVIPILLAFPITAQEYLDASCTWKFKDVAYVDGFTYFNTDYIDYIEGDTVINNLTYFKMHRAGSSISGFSPEDSTFVHEINEYRGALLEEDRKWHWIPRDSIQSQIIYDFNVEDGDSISYKGISGMIRLNVIDSFAMGGEQRNIFQLEGTAFNLIEGVGWNTSFDRAFFDPESFSYLQCFSKDKESLSMDLTQLEMLFSLEFETVDDCGEFLSNTDARMINSLSVQVYPNPFQSELNFTSTKNIDGIYITDLLGNLIYQDNGQLSKVDLTDLEGGIYYLTVFNESGVASRTIVKATN